jgi:hypothetical protein
MKHVRSGPDLRRPSIVVQNGQLNQREMRRTALPVDEHNEELRMQSVTDLLPSSTHSGDQRPGVVILYAIIASDGGADEPLPDSWTAPGHHRRRPPAGTDLKQRGFSTRGGCKNGWRSTTSTRPDVFLCVDEQNRVYFVPEGGGEGKKRCVSAVGVMAVCLPLPC